MLYVGIARRRRVLRTERRPDPARRAVSMADVVDGLVNHYPASGSRTTRCLRSCHSPPSTRYKREFRSITESSGGHQRQPQLRIGQYAYLI